MRTLGRTMLIEVALIVTWIGWTASQLPPGVTICPRTNNLNEYNECVLKQIKILMPHLSKGVPSLKLPALEPLFLPSLVVDRNLESLKIKANLTQIRIYGATNYALHDMKANPNELTTSFKMQLPHVHINGDYDVQGRLLLVSLTGIGHFSGNFTDIVAQVNARGKEVTDNNGVQRIEVDDLVTKIRIGDGNIKLTAPPSHTLSADAVATFFNTNPRLVLDIMSPIIEDTTMTVSKALAARALSVLTKQQIIP